MSTLGTGMAECGRPSGRGRQEMASSALRRLLGARPRRQSVVVIPSHDLLLVRLGFTPDPEGWDLSAFIGAVLEAIPKNGA